MSSLIANCFTNIIIINTLNDMKFEIMRTKSFCKHLQSLTLTLFVILMKSSWAQIIFNSYLVLHEILYPVFNKKVINRIIKIFF
jgi:hypothetical protein